MSRRSQQKFIRTWHRRLGPIIGIQLLLWSLGGIYFSWINTTASRGDADITLAQPVNLKYENYLASIAPLIRNSQLAWVQDIQLGKLLNIPVYRIIQDDRHTETYNAITGEQLSPLDRATAAAVASADLASEVQVHKVEKIAEQGGGYRGPVPAWKVTFDDWKATTVYISAGTGRVTARGNFLWQIYGFLWWLPFGNDPAGEQTRVWIIRATSVLGLVTIASGFFLWYLTTPLSRQTGKKKKSPRKKSRAKTR
ncbi:MAG: hypothetical protein JSU77_07180 [Fidelibacterota bacterium]|nr:MAG: hypothetical protein JSU77_07180 [Candidatus Neomarinimicrobiota bacterium]